MADADRIVTVPSADTSTPADLRIFALAPLPFLSNGMRTFDGGGTVFFSELLPGLARLGHRVAVVADAPAAREGERRAGLAWDVPNLTVEWFAYEHRSSQLPPPTPAYRRETEARIRASLEREMRAGRPDVVLVGREIVTPYVLDLCRQHGLATLVIAHGLTVAALVADGYPSDLHHELLDCLGRVDVIVAVAEHVATGLRSLGLARVVTICNAADCTRFRPAPKDPRLLDALDIAPDQVVVGHVSLLRPRKRPLDIVDSAATVLRAEPGCIYLIVGTGPLREAMVERAERLGIAEHFRWAGEVSHDDVPHYLNLIDVVLHPAEREGLPLIYLETQACGRALLASDIPPALEVVVPGRTGMLFRLGDVDDLAAKTLALVRSPDLRRQLGAEARAVSARASIEGWRDAYVRALREAVAHHGSSR